MYTVQVKSHPVEVARICGVDMLQIHGQIISPGKGVMLALDDGSRRRWIVADGSETPEIGQFLVVDRMNNTSFVIDAAKFGKYFEATEE